MFDISFEESQSALLMRCIVFNKIELRVKCWAHYFHPVPQESVQFDNGCGGGDDDDDDDDDNGGQVWHAVVTLSEGQGHQTGKDCIDL